VRYSQGYIDGLSLEIKDFVLDVKLTRIILNRRSGEDIIQVHLLINLAISYYTNLILTRKVILAKQT
jgi:hypothetical protein